MKVLNIVGARPNFVKIAPIIKEMRKQSEINYKLVHSGQHYEKEMSNYFFKDLDIPDPDVHLGISTGSHAEQTSTIMTKLEKVLAEDKPDLTLVVGDCNTTLAGALTSVKLKMPVAHVEAGLRSFNHEMPEEINRIITDRISRYLFTTEESANENLRNEGITKNVEFVGNVMIDTLLSYKDKIKKSNKFKEFGLEKNNYALLTLHRPENVDNKNNLKEILEAINEIQKTVKVIYPIHPRTEKKIKEFNLKGYIETMHNILLTSPLSYIDCLNLIMNSKLVLTDSGGIQEETTVLNIPCLTLRKETERPVTVTKGSNIVVGTKKMDIISKSLDIVSNGGKRAKIPELWDGNAAKRIVKVLKGI